MTEASLQAVEPRVRRRLMLRTLTRAGLNATLLVVLYYLLPMDRRLDAVAITLLAAGLLAFSCLVVWQIRAIVRSDYPGLRAIQALATAIPLFLLLFAVAYFLMARVQATAFSEPLSRTDALYFTVTVFSTVGFGDITPSTETARVVTIVQMIADLLVLGALLRVILGAVRVGQKRRATGESADQRSPGPAPLTNRTPATNFQDAAGAVGIVRGERAVYQSRAANVMLADVETPDGRRFEHHVVRMPSVAATVVLDDDRRVLLMWRHRFIDDRWSWEVPVGIVDPGETAETAARRKVVEQTSWRPGPLTNLLDFQPTFEIVDAPHKLFLAAGATEVGAPTDITGAQRVDWIPLDQVPALIARGELRDSPSLIALLYVYAGLDRTAPPTGQPMPGSPR